MKVELVQVAPYPSMLPFGEAIRVFPIFEEETSAAREARYAKAQAAYEAAHNRRKATYEGSCRVEGCGNAPRHGSKFCGLHLGLRRQIPRRILAGLGTGAKVRVG